MVLKVKLLQLCRLQITYFPDLFE